MIITDSDGETWGTRDELIRGLFYAYKEGMVDAEEAMALLGKILTDSLPIPCATGEELLGGDEAEKAI